MIARLLKFFNPFRKTQRFVETWDFCIIDYQSGFSQQYRVSVGKLNISGHGLGHSIADAFAMAAQDWNARAADKVWTPGCKTADLGKEPSNG